MIARGTLPWRPILGKIGELTFIRHASVKWIAISQFNFKILNSDNSATLCAVVLEIEGGKFNFLDVWQKLAYSLATKYCRKR